MEYALTVLVFLLVCAGGVAVLAIVARVTSEPGGEEGAPFATDDSTPLGDTDQHSDAGDERQAA
jgi:hypothetical protein